MKKFNFKALTSLVLVVAILTGVFATLSVFADTATPTANIIRKNLTYGSSLKLMYAVTTDNVLPTDEVEVVIYDAEGNVIENTVKSAEKEIVDGIECDVFTSERGVAPQNIDTYVYAKVQVKRAGAVVYESEAVRYSVLEYLYTVLTTTENLAAEKKAMYETLLAYANAADVALNGTEEGSRIEDYKYVRIENGTLDGTHTAGTYLKGTVLSGLTNTIGENVEYKVEQFDENGQLLNSKTYDVDELADLKVGDFNMVITAQEKSDIVVPPSWKLVTNIAMLQEGVQIVIAAKGSNVAMGASSSNGNNRTQTAITKNSDGTINTPSSSVQIITLVAGTKSGTWGLKVDNNKYLYAASSSSNYLKTGDLNDNASWSISVTTAGVATVKSVGSYSRNWMRYNSSSSLFACYASGQADICIYAYV